MHGSRCEARLMNVKRLCLTALALLLAAVLLAPATCSQGSDDARPRCDTLLGYWTPFGEWMQGPALGAVVLAGMALSRRRKTRR